MSEQSCGAARGGIQRAETAADTSFLLSCEIDCCSQDVGVGREDAARRDRPKRGHFQQAVFSENLDHKTRSQMCLGSEKRKSDLKHRLTSQQRQNHSGSKPIAIGQQKIDPYESHWSRIICQSRCLQSPQRSIVPSYLFAVAVVWNDSCYQSSECHW